ncbi:MAG: acyl-CoA thioester hydrolase/BAAT C-terminal domain-containing protein [Candidatus Acidiferrales bacterium]
MKPTWRKAVLLFAVWLLGSGIAVSSAQTLQVIPNRALLDEAAVIRATGLQPGERVTIQARLIDGVGHPWASSAQFVADAQGTIDTSKQAPEKGPYKEVSSMGLVWSMMPAASGVRIYRSPSDLSPQVIDFQLLRKGQQAVSAQLEQLRVADGVHSTQVEGQIHGVLFVPSGSGPHPGVLVVGGSEGGLPLEKAAWLASHGFTALALAYFRYDGLPPDLEAIPLEYFGNALSWMMMRREISADRIAVVGTSRGGELALQLGSMFPNIKAVVAYVPANARFPACCGNTRVPYAWTWRGEPLSYVPLRLTRFPTTAIGAAIAVENTHGPILVISGDSDGVWPSPMMTEAVVDRLKHAHFPFAVERLNYPHAGHRAGNPQIVPAWHGEVQNPVSGREMNLGGNAKGDAASSLDAIPKVLAFLQTSLAPKSSPQ